MLSSFCHLILSMRVLGIYKKEDMHMTICEECSHLMKLAKIVRSPRCTTNMLNTAFSKKSDDLCVPVVAYLLTL